MSLINQVLQNVEKRQAPPSSQGWSAQVKPVLSEVPGHSGSVRWMLGLSLLLVAGWLLSPGIVQWRAQKNALSVLDQFPPAAGEPTSRVWPKSNELQVSQAVVVDTRFTKFLFSDWQSSTLSYPVSATQGAPSDASRPRSVAAPQSAFVMAPTLAMSVPEVHALSETRAVGGMQGFASAIAPKSNIKLAAVDKESISMRIKPEQEVNVLIQRAVDAEQKGRVSEAMLVLRQALTTYPQSEDARLLLVNFLQDAKQEAEALTLLQGGLKAYPEQVGLRKALAKWQLAHSQATLAIETLNPLAANASQDMDWQWMQAMAHQQVGQHQAALPYFERALQLQPAHAQAYVAYAVSLQALGLRPQALQQLRYAQDFPMSERMSEFVLQRTQQLSQVGDR